MADSRLQWLRVCKVIVGTTELIDGIPTGRGISVDETFRIQFEVIKTIQSVPNTARIRIYNLSKDSENKIRGEFDEVLVNAGYKGSELLIFRGNLRHIFRLPEAPSFITDIDAADGDRDFRKSIVNETLAAGTSSSQLLDKVMATFKTTKKGHVVIKEKARSRGKVISAPARQVLDDLARDSGAHWSIQNGNLEIVPVDSTLPTEAIVLSPETGLLGTPQIDDKGITAKCLLNPRIRVNGKVKIDNIFFQARIHKQTPKKPGSKAKPKSHELTRLDPDGIYKVVAIKHSGDTRGEEWLTEVKCIALQKAIPAGRVAA
jgi:hypothetical protein